MNKSDHDLEYCWCGTGLVGYIGNYAIGFVAGLWWYVGVRSVGGLFDHGYGILGYGPYRFIR
ncbi:MAG: hypothetical protein ACLFM7_05480 [Bacteroidales bacterium]